MTRKKGRSQDSKCGVQIRRAKEALNIQRRSCRTQRGGEGESWGWGLQQPGNYIAFVTFSKNCNEVFNLGHNNLFSRSPFLGRGHENCEWGI